MDSANQASSWADSKGLLVWIAKSFSVVATEQNKYFHKDFHQTRFEQVSNFRKLIKAKLFNDGGSYLLRNILHPSTERVVNYKFIPCKHES